MDPTSTKPMIESTNKKTVEQIETNRFGSTATEMKQHEEATDRHDTLL
jgi:hypothetical protein